MTRTPEAVARQRRGLIREALSVVRRLPDWRLQQLAPGLTPEQHRAELLTFAEREPRRALTAFAKESH
jgi:hypothetical protein